MFVGGSLATGDYVPGVSDLDLVAVVDGPVGAARTRDLTTLHRALDAGDGARASLGCVYVEESRLSDRDARHPTWTHGSLVDRTLSGIARAELVLHGYALLGRPPQDVLPAMGPDDVRDAARSEVLGYWARAARHPWWWLDPVMPDLGLTAMARGRYAMSTGEPAHQDTRDRARARPGLADRADARQTARRARRVSSRAQRGHRLDGHETDRRGGPLLVPCSHFGTTTVLATLSCRACCHGLSHNGHRQSSSRNTETS